MHYEFTLYDCPSPGSDCKRWHGWLLAVLAPAAAAAAAADTGDCTGAGASETSSGNLVPLARRPEDFYYHG